MRSLVTGGAGFIGSHIVDCLLELGHEVYALDDLSGGFPENVSEQAEFITASVTDEAFIHWLCHAQRFDYIFHCAAYAAEGLSHFIRRFNYENNVIGSINLINAAVRNDVKCFVFTSSIAVYGNLGKRFVEWMTPEPEDPYGIAKYAVELDLKAAHSMFGLNYLIFRPHNVYGQRQNIGDLYRNVVGIFMNQVMQDKPCTIFGDGSQTRAFSHIYDVAPVIARSVQLPISYNQVFNIGADAPYTVNALAECVQEVLGKKVGITYLPARHEVQHAFSSHDRLKASYGVESKIPLEVGLRMMADWAQKHGIRHGRPFGKVEIRKNLPESWSKAIGD